MHTHIQVYKNKWKHTRLYLIGFGVLILFGFIGLVMAYAFNTSFIPALDTSNYIFLTLYAMMSYGIVWNSTKKTKYFVEWDNHTIKYLLPGSNKTESIPIKNIKSIDEDQIDIVIQLNNNETKRFNFTCFFFPERQAIIDFFEEIKENLAKKAPIDKNDAQQDDDSNT